MRVRLARRIGVRPTLRIVRELARSDRRTAGLDRRHFLGRAATATAALLLGERLVAAATAAAASARRTHVPHDASVLRRLREHPAVREARRRFGTPDWHSVHRLPAADLRGGEARTASSDPTAYAVPLGSAAGTVTVLVLKEAPEGAVACLSDASGVSGFPADAVVVRMTIEAGQVRQTTWLTPDGTQLATQSANGTVTVAWPADASSVPTARASSIDRTCFQNCLGLHASTTCVNYCNACSRSGSVTSGWCILCAACAGVK
jgi:hypothetical protein